MVTATPAPRLTAEGRHGTNPGQRKVCGLGWAVAKRATVIATGWFIWGIGWMVFRFLVGGGGGGLGMWWDTGDWVASVVIAMLV